MVAGIPINVTNHANFALNTTYDFHTNGSRSGLVVGIPTGKFIVIQDNTLIYTKLQLLTTCPWSLKKDSQTKPSMSKLTTTFRPINSHFNSTIQNQCLPHLLLRLLHHHLHLPLLHLHLLPLLLKTTTSWSSLSSWRQEESWFSSSFTW